MLKVNCVCGCDSKPRTDKDIFEDAKFRISLANTPMMLEIEKRGVDVIRTLRHEVYGKRLKAIIEKREKVVDKIAEERACWYVDAQKNGDFNQD